MNEPVTMPLRSPITVDALTLKLLIVVFGMWAGAVAWGIGRVTSELSTMHNESRRMYEEVMVNRQAMLQRLTAQEEINRAQDKQITALENSQRLLSIEHIELGRRRN
jgi:hypothetical protein